MKVFYRKSYGCFVFTDRYVRPWWWSFRLRPALISVRFSFLSYLRCLWRSALLLLMTSPSTKSTPTGTSESLNTNTPSSIASAASQRAVEPPRLEKSVDYVLDNLRETKHMIASLLEREKRLKSEVQQLREQGKLDHLVDEDDPQKFNGDGLSISLYKGRKRRVYDSAIQMEIDAKQKELIASSTWPTAGINSLMSSRRRTGG